MNGRRLERRWLTGYLHTDVFLLKTITSEVMARHELETKAATSFESFEAITRKAAFVAVTSWLSLRRKKSESRGMPLAAHR